MTEVLHINDYFQLQKRSDVIFPLLFCSQRKSNMFFSKGKRSFQYIKLYNLLINITLQYILVQGCCSFAALEEHLPKKAHKYFFLQGFIFFEPGKGGVLITSVRVVIHQFAIWKCSRYWGCECGLIGILCCQVNSAAPLLYEDGAEYGYINSEGLQVTIEKRKSDTTYFLDFFFFLLCCVS